MNRHQQQRVITPVFYSAWATSIVVTKKANGTIRIYADFSTGLNTALEQHHYLLSVPADLFTVLNGGTLFAKRNLADAYLQVEVDKASREQLTINTHRELFQYSRLHFGVKIDPYIFQQPMDTILSSISGVAVYLEDILVVAATLEQLGEHTSLILQRISDKGFRLPSEKCQFLLLSVKYLEFNFDPNPGNIRATTLMHIPTNVSALPSFMVLVTFY